MITYSIERRVFYSGLFKKQAKPLWCLLQHRLCEDVYYVGGNFPEFDRYVVSKVIISSEDKKVVQQEFYNFTGYEYGI